MIPWDYYRTAALRAGVPELWVPDAVQDIAIRVWQSRTPYWRTVVHHAAVNAAERYRSGSHNRKKDRPRMVSLEGIRLTGRDPHALTERILDFRVAWAGLTAIQRRHILRALNDGRAGTGQRTTRSQQTRTYQSRQKLRRLCA